MLRRIFFIFLLSSTISYANIIKIATNPNNPPFSLLSDKHNHFSGIDMDIVSELCKRIKAKCHYQAMHFDNIFLAIETKQVDIAIASLIITPSRQQHHLFSLPYLASNIQFLTNLKSSLNVPDDVHNKRIGIRKGAPFKHFLTALYKHHSTPVEYLSIADMLVALQNKKVDSILLDQSSAQYWYANNSDQYKLIGAPIPFGGGYGIMTNADNKKLMAEINKALLQMEADGGYQKIYTKYFA